MHSLGVDQDVKWTQLLKVAKLIHSMILTLFLILFHMRPNDGGKDQDQFGAVLTRLETVLIYFLEICSGLDVAIREFFHHASDADLHEYCISLNLQKKKLLVVERLVETGLEAKKEYRELISKALLYLYQQEYLTQNDLVCGFRVSVFYPTFYLT